MTSDQSERNVCIEACFSDQSAPGLMNGDFQIKIKKLLFSPKLQPFHPNITAMMSSVMRSTYLPVWFGLLLVSLLGSRRCSSFPVGESHHSAKLVPIDASGIEPVHDLDTLKRVTGALNGGYGGETRDISPPASEGELDGFVRPSDGVRDADPRLGEDDSNSEETSWQAWPQRAVNDQPSYGDVYANYDETDWGSYFPASSSSSEQGDDLSHDYGLGVFTSEVLDPSVSHSVFVASSPLEKDSLTEPGQNLSTGRVSFRPSEVHDDPQTLLSQLTNGIETPSAGPSISDENSLQEVGDELSQGAIRGGVAPNGLEINPNVLHDATISNVLSSLLSPEENEDGERQDDNGDKSFPERNPVSTKESDGAGNQEKDHAGISVTDAAEKPADISCRTIIEDDSWKGVTEDEVIDHFLDRIFSSNRLVSYKEKNPRPIRKKCV